MLFGLITSRQRHGRAARPRAGSISAWRRCSKRSVGSWRSPVSIRTCRGAQTCGCSPSSTDFARPPGRSTRHWGESISATRASHRVSGYSTGMRQRLGIAAALLRRPRLLLLDEPTSGLDPAGTRAVAALVRELAAQGVAVLLSSHQIGELEKVCDSLHGGAPRPGGVGRDRRRARWPGSPARRTRCSPATTRTRSRCVSGITAIRDPARAAGRSRRGRRAPTWMDELVAALGDAHVLIRRLELIVSPLESMFFALTYPTTPGDSRRAGAAAACRSRSLARRMTTISPTAPAARPELGVSQGVRNAYETELHQADGPADHAHPDPRLRRSVRSPSR